MLRVSPSTRILTPQAVQIATGIAIGFVSCAVIVLAAAARAAYTKDEPADCRAHSQTGTNKITPTEYQSAEVIGPKGPSEARR